MSNNNDLSSMFLRFVWLVNQMGANDSLRNTSEFLHFQEIIDKGEGVCLSYSVFHAEYNDFVHCHDLYDNIVFDFEFIHFDNVDVLFRVSEELFRIRDLHEIADEIEKCISNISFTIELENFSFESF